MNRKKKEYQEKIAPELMKRFGYKSVMQVPRLKKVVINCGVGEVTSNSKAIDYVVKSVTAVTGQKPKICRSKKSIASFKLRAGLPIGCMVTMRGERMWNFVDLLVSAALPRVGTLKALLTPVLMVGGTILWVLRRSLYFHR
jgi:large subunit ribosomal protein L5